MKSLRIIASAIIMATTSLAGFAQDSAEEIKFKPHWSLHIQGGVSHTLGEAEFFDLVSPAVQLGASYQFNPVFGVRLTGNGWEAKGGWVNPQQAYKWDQATAALDLNVNLSNAIWGWNPKRLLNVNVFAGGGLNMAWSNDEANQLNTRGHELEYLWDGTKVRPVGKFGLGLDFRVNDIISINLEGNANILSDKFNSKKADNADWHFNALVGLKINLGKTYTKVETPVEATPIIPEEQDEPKPVVKKEEPKPVVKKMEEKKIDVFFKISSSIISEAENAKIKELIAFLKANPNAKVQVTGYADAGTGNPRINMKYSQNRADAVVKALTEGGIALDRITSEAKGDTVQPFAENDKNRVAICIAKE